MNNLLELLKICNDKHPEFHGLIYARVYADGTGSFVHECREGVTDFFLDFDSIFDLIKALE